MSDLKDKGNLPVEPKEAVAGSRRRFAKSGLMGGAVLMSLSGRSAFGQGVGFTANCSVDTLFSVYNGGSTYAFDTTTCEYGCDPDFWVGGDSNSAWAKIAALPGGSGGWSRTTLIETVFSDINADDSSLDNDAIDPDRSNNKLKGKTLAEILNSTTGDSFVRDSVRHALVAILNSYMMGFYYTKDYTAQSITEWFNTVWTNYLAAPDNSVTQNDLAGISTTLAPLNNRNCPLNANAGGGGGTTSGNPFYDDAFRSKIEQY